MDHTPVTPLREKKDGEKRVLDSRLTPVAKQKRASLEKQKGKNAPLQLTKKQGPHAPTLPKTPKDDAPRHYLISDEERTIHT